MKRLNHLPFLVLCLLLTPALARAGNISGTVKDLFTRNPVQNVEVRVNNIADTSDVNGNYNLISVPNGRDTITFRPLDYSHLNAKHDSLVVSGNQTFNATLPDTTHTNPNASVVRVRADELKNVHLFLGKNPYLWDTKVNKNIPVTIKRFNTSDSTSIWNALNWRMALGDTNYFKFVPGTDTSQGIFIRPGSGNNTATYTSGGYIDWAIVELGDIFSYDVVHEVSYHGISKPSPHVTIYSPSNYTLGTSVLTQPKDVTYMDIAYELQYTKQDGINNLDMKDFTDTLTVGVEIEPQLVMPVKNNGLILHTPYPNPARYFVDLDYSLDRPRRVEISLFNALGQLVGKARGAGGPGAHVCLWDVSRVPAGVYFLVLGDGGGQAVARFLVVH